jgi:glucosamine--fructose-6-phosphate aminotransferase (isomerizing)
MGSSFHVFFPLYIRMAQHNLPVQLLETSELIYYYSSGFSSDTLIIAASQSGQSAEIVRLVEMIHHRSSLVAITNTPTSPLALAADFTIFTNVGSESSVSCKTYLGTLASVLLLGETVLSDHLENMKRQLNQASTAVSYYLDHARSHIEAIKQDFEGIQFLQVVGRGPSLSSVGTGALIIKEAAHFPTEGLSSAAFRHGPFEMVSRENCALVFQGSPPADILNDRLYHDIQKSGGRAFLVAVNPAKGWQNLPAIHPDCLQMLEILPAQMISIALAEMNGLQAGNFQLGGKITTVE